jgi:hypothetical protein
VAATGKAVTRALAYGAVAACVAFAVPAEAANRDSRGKLPPQTLRGPAVRLHQYPTIATATRKQRVRAQALRASIREAARGWQGPRAAAAGFPAKRPRRRGASTGVLWVHAEHREYQHDTVYLDPRRPETLVYADVPGRPLVLIGVMFSMPRGLRGPTPGGPITRWHTHRVCARGNERGLTPRKDGTCPPRTTSRQGSEMMHVWLTRDLRSTFAIHAPVPELCRAGLIPWTRCRRGHHGG